MRKTPGTLARELYVSLMATPERSRPKVMREFFYALTLKRQSAMRPRIVDAFARLALLAEGKKMGRIVTARKLDATERAHFYKRFPDVAFVEHVDPTLVGGAVVTVGDEVIDGTIAGTIQNLKRTLSYV